MAIIETRGIWLTATDSQVLSSRQNLAEAMDFLAATGFNVVFPVVWRQGTTLYPSQVMRSHFGSEIAPQYPNRDCLAELIVEARRVGIRVIPWFEYGFACAYNSNGGKLLQQKPEWAARDCHGNLLNKNGFEWLNALDPQVQEFILSLVLEVVQNYNIDGIQGDDRLPALPCEAGYDRGTVTRYRQIYHRYPPQNPKEPQWLQWRADLLSDFWTRLYQAVKAVNPELLVSVAPNIYDWGLKEYLQDYPAWLQRGTVDLIHPQIYRRDYNSYSNILSQVKQQFTPKQLIKLAPGMLLKLGSYHISPEYLLQAIAYNRQYGIAGEVFFFYEGLRANHDTLARVLQSGPYAQPASLPTVANLNHSRSFSIRNPKS